MTEFEALLRLHMTRGIGTKTYQALIERFGSSEAILNAPRAELEAVQGIGPKLATAVIETSRNIDIATEINLAKERTFKSYRTRVINTRNISRPSTIHHSFFMSRATSWKPML